MIWSSLPALLEGTLVTIQLTVVSLFLGSLLGLLLAFGQVYGPALIRFIFYIYERVLRSIPLLVILFLIFYGLPYMNIRMTPISAAILGLALRSSAYLSQIFRGSFESISTDQITAARSIGMTQWQTFLHIVLPQALRISIPPFTNEYAIVLKDTTMAYAIGVIELMRQGYYVMFTTYDPLPVFLAIAAIFFILTFGISKLLLLLEKKLKIPGIGVEQ